MKIHHPLSWKKRLNQENRREHKKEKRSQFSAEDIIEWFKDIRAIIETCCFFASNSSSLFEKSKCNKLEWHSIMGVGDAALTGMLTGAVWADKGKYYWDDQSLF